MHSWTNFGADRRYRTLNRTIQTHFGSIFIKNCFFWTFQALWSWAAFLAGAFIFLRKLTFGLPGLSRPGQACPGQALSRPGLVQARPEGVYVDSVGPLGPHEAKNIDLGLY